MLDSGIEALDQCGGSAAVVRPPDERSERAASADGRGRARALSPASAASCPSLVTGPSPRSPAPAPALLEISSWATALREDATRRPPPARSSRPRRGSSRCSRRHQREASATRTSADASEATGRSPRLRTRTPSGRRSPSAAEPRSGAPGRSAPISSLASPGDDSLQAVELPASKSLAEDQSALVDPVARPLSGSTPSSASPSTVAARSTASCARLLGPETHAGRARAARSEGPAAAPVGPDRERRRARARTDSRRW